MLRFQVVADGIQIGHDKREIAQTVSGDLKLLSNGQGEIVG
jgi:hypothetical protein